MIFSEIGRNFHISGSTFGGEVDLTGSVIGGEFHLASGWNEDSPTWQSGASLILRNAKAGALQTRRDSWNMSGEEGLLPTDLTGFTFNQLGGLDTPSGFSMSDESAEWLIGWIEAQRDHGTYYDPQPYTHLALAMTPIIRIETTFKVANVCLTSRSRITWTSSHV